MQNNTKKIFNKIKQNKVKIIVTSTFMATIIGCSIGLGLALNVTKSSQVDKPIYTPEIAPVKPGELKFDQTGKPIIPVIVDKENPTGDYKYEINYKNQIDLIEKKQVINYDKKYFDERLNISLTHNQAELTKIVEEKYSNYNIKLDKDYISLIDYYIPNNSLKFNDEILSQNLVKSLFDDASKYTLENNVSFSDLSDLMSLCGINFDKEFNKLNTAAEINNPTDNISIYGGGGAMPQPDPIKPPNTAPPTIAMNEVTINSRIDSFLVDLTTRVIIEIVYSALMIAISIFSLIMAIATFGASLASNILDLILCGIAVVFAVLEYKEMLKITENTKKLKELLESLGMVNTTISFIKSTNIWQENIVKFKKILNSTFDLKLQTNTNLIDTSIRKKVISKCLSFLSFGLMIVKAILDSVISYDAKFFDELYKTFAEIDKSIM